jgi:hypothetical protein
MWHAFPVATTLELPLKGPKGEPGDLFRTIMSHGVADLPPGHVDEEAAAYTTTLALTLAQPSTKCPNSMLAPLPARPSSI